MVTRSEVRFPPPPRPLEPWREFLAQQERVSSDFHQASPHAFLELMASDPQLRSLSALRSDLDARGCDRPGPPRVLLGVITRKFSPNFHKKRDFSESCCCAVWVRDASDLVRVTLWEGSVWEHYSKLQEGRLLAVKGFKVRPLYQPEKQQGPEWARLSPSEVSIGGRGPGSGAKSSLASIDLHTLWQFRPSDSLMKASLRGFLNFGFCPAPLDELSLCPLTSDARRSVVARVIYKSSERTAHSKLGEVPALWLALFDGSQSGPGREYVWLYLVSNFQPGLLERLRANQLIVATCLSPVCLFHASWQLVPGHALLLLSTPSTQVYILEEEPDSSCWHYTQSVYRQKARALADRAEQLSLRFCDCAPEATRVPPCHTLFRQGNLESRIPYLT